jgi:hypothetical protein
MNKFLFRLTLALLLPTLVVHAQHKKVIPQAPAKLSQGCSPSSAIADLDINNVRASLLLSGDMWWDLNSAQYEVPKGSGKNVIFNAGFCVGGLSDGGQLKLAAMTYRQTGVDFWPGPLFQFDGAISPNDCEEWDKHFKLTRAEVNSFVEYRQNPAAYPSYQVPSSIKNWPAKGSVYSPSMPVAPFVDVNGDGMYDYKDGDYPAYDLYDEGLENSLHGDQTLFYVFNDKGNVHSNTGGEAIGLEIHAQAYAYASDDPLNDMTFYQYKLINRSSDRLNEAYVGYHVDVDIGYYLDDFIASDVSRGMAYAYNGDYHDEGESGYGYNPPAIGFDFFEGLMADVNDGVDNDQDGWIDEGTDGIDNDQDGLIDALDSDERERIKMSGFMAVSNSPTITGNPITATHFYQRLRNRWKDESKMTYGGSGVGGFHEANYMFPGKSDPYGWGVGGSFKQPKSLGEWSEESCGNTPADRRFMMSAGSFTLEPGGVNSFTLGVVWARASTGGPQASVDLMLLNDDYAQALFNSNFKPIETPDLPQLKIVEMNQELVLLLLNDSSSNNFKDSYKTKNPSVDHYEQGFYRFQGYKVYQLKHDSVGMDDLSNPDVARLIAQCDIEDDVSTIINKYYNKAYDIWEAVVEVDGGNNGIQHSFQIKKDAFTNEDLVNFKTYYFAAVAYAYTDANTNLYNAHLGTGQHLYYLQSDDELIPYSAIPHKSAPEQLGTVLHSSYGDRIDIRRINGTGNGSNVLSFTEETEQLLLDSNVLSQPVYKGEHSPIKVKVVDPLKLKNGRYTVLFDHDSADADWSLYDEHDRRIVSSDYDIAQPAEKWISSLGISISMKQVLSPAYSLYNTGSVIGSGVSVSSNETPMISAELSFENDLEPWLDGVADRDCTYNAVSDSWDWAYNWIRAGEYVHGFTGFLGGEFNPSVLNEGDDYQFTHTGQVQLTNWGLSSDIIESDRNEYFEEILGGTWAPFKFASHFHDGPSPHALVNSKLSLNDLQSVEVVFTPDQAKWSRCFVLEAQDVPAMAEGEAMKLCPRKSPSVDKEGLTDGSGEGMGWFPGYAMNLETGERLNIMFAEDSWLKTANGDDMLWNPTSNDKTELPPQYSYNEQLDEHVFGGGKYLLGGKHFVYVFSSRYDSCRVYEEVFTEIQQQPSIIQSLILMGDVFKETMWVGFPKLKEHQRLLSNEARVKLAVKKPYRSAEDPQVSTMLLPTREWLDSLKNNIEIVSLIDTLYNGEWIVKANVIEHHAPEYAFDLSPYAPSTAVLDTAVSAIDLVNVVPNPYHASSAYEGYDGSDRVRFINLPTYCTLEVFTVGGERVRTFNKSDDVPAFLSWDLKNEYGNLISTGVYIIKVTAYDQSANVIGEKVLKWCGYIGE